MLELIKMCVKWKAYKFIILLFQKLMAYLKYMTTVGTLLGGQKTSTREQMKEVLKFEMKLAKVCLICSWVDKLHAGMVCHQKLGVCRLAHLSSVSPLDP